MATRCMAGSRAATSASAPGIEAGMLERVEELYERHGRRKISLVGWSLGGIYARQLAKMRPREGAFGDQPGQSASPAAPRRPMPGGSTNSPRARASRIAITRWPAPLAAPPPVPTTSVSAAPTGSAPGRPASTERASRSRISRSMAATAGVGPSSGGRLCGRRPSAQPEGQWKKFDRSGWKSLVFPDWRRG